MGYPEHYQCLKSAVHFIRTSVAGHADALAETSEISQPTISPIVDHSKAGGIEAQFFSKKYFI